MASEIDYQFEAEVFAWWVGQSSDIAEIEPTVYRGEVAVTAIKWIERHMLDSVFIAEHTRLGVPAGEYSIVTYRAEHEVVGDFVKGVTVRPISFVEGVME